MAFRVIFAAAVLANALATSSMLAQEHSLGDLAERAKAATTSEKMIQFVKWSQELPENEVRHFIESGASNKDVQLRLMAALLIPRVQRQQLMPDVVHRLLSDPTPRVRRTAWVATRGDQLSADAQREGLRANDLYVRATALLWSESAETVAAHCCDPSPLLRALAIRRLGKIALDKHIDASFVKDALRICCIDADPLVRSNGLLVARWLMVLPEGVAAGMVLDARNFISLESVLVGEEASNDDRVRYGLDEEYFPTTYLLNMRNFERTISERPPRAYKELILPMSVQRCIGSEAANLWNAINPDEARPFLLTVIELPQPPSVWQCSLSSVLGIAVEWPSNP